MNEIHVLLVDSELSDVRFIREALDEIEERTHAGTWVHCRVDHLERAEDAALVLASDRPDIVLFNPTLEDSGGLETFSILHDTAPGIPLIALLQAGEEGLGRRMLRQGAQDFVIKSEIDCQPLARSMLNAIERQRFARSAQFTNASDLETGLYTQAGFSALAARDVQLAHECQRSLSIILAEVDALEEVDGACGREAVHDLVVEGANVVRAAAGDTPLVGRVGLGRFAMLAWEATPDRLIGAVQNRVQADHHSFAFVFGYASTGRALTTVDELLDAAGAVLYENKQAYSNIH